MNLLTKNENEDLVSVSLPLVPLEEEKEKTFISLDLNYNLYITETSETTLLKIKEEKRRRNQAYIMLDYYLSMLSPVDYFDIDSFSLTTESKLRGQFWNKKTISSEFILFSLFQENSSFQELLLKYNVNQEALNRLFLPPNIFEPSISLFKPLTSFFTALYQAKFYVNSKIPSFFSKRFSIDPFIKYSNEFDYLQTKASENAIDRFKTPLVSSEIFLLTIIEERKKNSRMGTILNEIILSDEDWYLLRYDLLRRLHQKETALRNQIPKSQKYFGYLFHTQVTNSQFEFLLTNKYLASRVAIFRKLLFLELLENNVFENLKQETNQSIRVTNQRSYTI